MEATRKTWRKNLVCIFFSLHLLPPFKTKMLEYTYYNIHQTFSSISAKYVNKLSQQYIPICWTFIDWIFINISMHADVSFVQQQQQMLFFYSIMRQQILRMQLMCFELQTRNDWTIHKNEHKQMNGKRTKKMRQKFFS